MFFFFFFLNLFDSAGQRSWVQPVIFEKDKVTCLGVEYAQRRVDTYPFIESNEGNKMLYSQDR